MFTLQPGGSDSNGNGNNKGWNNPQVWFWGQLTVYFVVLRGAFWFMAGPDERRLLSGSPAHH